MCQFCPLNLLSLLHLYQNVRTPANYPSVGPPRIGTCQIPSRYTNNKNSPQNEQLQKYPEDTTRTKLIHFVGAACANNSNKRGSTTGFAMDLKAQSVTAMRLTKAKLIAAITKAKNIKYIRSALTELGILYKEPIPIYENNKSAIEIINTNKPTGRSRHIDLRLFFLIKLWEQDGHITMKHIPGVIKPMDDLKKPLGYIVHS